MNEQSSGEKILEKIKQAHIKPKPRWEFLLKNCVIWALFIISILIGSLSFGIMIFMFKNNCLQHFINTSGVFQKFLIGLPYFWLLILIAFIAIAFYNFKHTNKGYRHNPLFIVSAGILLSIIIGSIVYAIGGSEKLEDIFYRKMPFYQKMMKFQGRMLFDPQKGRVPGIVIEINKDYIKIQDFMGKIHSISTSTDQFVIGQRIIIYGKPQIDNSCPCELKPLIKTEHFKPKPCPRCLNN